MKGIWITVISAIIATQNEMHSYFFELVLQSLQPFPEIEVVAVDGGSTDGSLRLLDASGVKLLEVSPSLSYAERLNIGLDSASGELILLQHPQALIEKEGLIYLLDHETDMSWGGFRQRYENKSPMLAFNSWYSNEMKGRRRGLISFDHCPFFQRSLLNARPMIPTVTSFEDAALSFKLREQGKPQILPFYATASCSRFIEESLLTQSLKGQAKKASSLLGLATNIRYPNKSSKDNDRRS